MEPTASAVLVTTLVAGGVILVLWRERVVRARHHVARLEHAKERERRLANPDFDGLERRLGRPLPASFRQLYRDHDLVEGGGVVIEHPNPLESADHCFVAWFNPADPRGLDDVWTGCEGLFAIGDNGCNDEYLVDLSQQDPDVLYHLHETGELQRIGCRLSEFLAAPRRAADAHERPI